VSKIGKQPVELEEGISVKSDSGVLVVKGPKGELSRKIPREIEILISDNKVTVNPKSNTKQARSLHGTFRAHIFNMTKGVKDGWEKRLEMVGVGYRAEVKDKDLVLTVGFSHPVEVKASKGIVFSINKSEIVIEGMDKEVVGQTAAKIRAIRPPEPYKGKGIKYKDEVVRRKAGKAAKTSET